jgi:hypothetical protein
MAAIRTGIIETENQFRNEDQPDGTLALPSSSTPLLALLAGALRRARRFNEPLLQKKVPVCCWRVSRASGWSWPTWATRAPCWGPTAPGPPTNSRHGTTPPHPQTPPPRQATINPSINQRRSGALCTQRETRPQIRSRAHCSRQDRTRLGLRPPGAWARGNWGGGLNSGAS